MRTVRHGVDGFIFEWDREKATANWLKHGVTFEEAASVLVDPLGQLLPTQDFVGGEVRFAMIGYSHERRLLVVVHVERGALIRIISARLPTRREVATMEGP